MKILIIIEKAEHNYSAYSPDVPGCVAVGETRQEVKQNMREALQYHLEMMLEEHLPLPEPNNEADYVDIPTLV